MRKLLVIIIVLLVVLIFDCVMCKYRIKTLEYEVASVRKTSHLKDSLIDIQDSLLDKYRGIFKEYICDPDCIANWR